MKLAYSSKLFWSHTVWLPSVCPAGARVWWHDRHLKIALKMKDGKFLYYCNNFFDKVDKYLIKFIYYFINKCNAFKGRFFLWFLNASSYAVRSFKWIALIHCISFVSFCMKYDHFSKEVEENITSGCKYKCKCNINMKMIQSELKILPTHSFTRVKFKNWSKKYFKKEIRTHKWNNNHDLAISQDEALSTEC